MAPRDIDFHAPSHLPYRPVTTTATTTTAALLLEDPPYLSLSGHDEDDANAGARAGFCKGHGDNVKCDRCSGGRGDVIVVNEIDMGADNEGRGDRGAGGRVMLTLEIPRRDDEVRDSDDEDEDEDDEDGGVDDYCPSASSPLTAATITPIGDDAPEWEAMVPQQFPCKLLEVCSGDDIVCAGSGGGGGGGGPLCYPLPHSSTLLPQELKRELVRQGSIYVATVTGSEDSVMADGADDDTMADDSGYESANGDEGICRQLDRDVTPEDRCCGSIFGDLGGGSYEALYQHLKGPVEGIDGRWQRSGSPASECGESEMPAKRTICLDVVGATRREVRGCMKDMGGKSLVGRGQKLRKVGKARGGGKKMLRKWCFVGHAGAAW